MAEIKVGETYAYLVKENAAKSHKISRIESEDEIQGVIKDHTKTIFGKEICWIAEKGYYGDMFGLAEDERLVVVEIKGPKSRGHKHTGYGLEQIRRKFKEIRSIGLKKTKLLEICRDYGIKNPEELFKKKLGLIFKRLRLHITDFYFISTQLHERIIESAELIAKKHWIGPDWEGGHKIGRPNVRCILLNVYKIGSQKILVFNKYR